MNAAAVNAPFWSKVDQSGGANACWPWTGYRMPSGYGQTGRNRKAHRLAYELAYGIAPADRVVMHSCDNPPCCNPAHLRLGSLADNWDDMRRKGRHAVPSLRGEAHPHARLTEEAVRQMRLAASNGEAHHVIARRFGISRSAASSIIRRHSWSHVA